MLSRNRILLLPIISLMAAILACNLPSGATPTADLALTLTALAQTKTDTPAPTDTATLSFTGTAAFTSTPTVPVVSVSVNTNCRTGPGTQYDRVGGLLVGQTAVVVGKNSSTGYWIIQNPDSAGTCWLWGEYAIVSGNTANLPEYPIPPTPTPTNTPTPTTTLTPSSTPTPTFTPTPTP